MTTERAIIILHGIGEPARTLEPGEARFWLTETEFKHALDRIADLGPAAPEITFDDGNASDLTHALPALAARDLTATFFLLAGRLDQRGSLSSTDVRTLAEAGHAIGLHGHDHVDWRRLDAAGRQREFRTARVRLQEASNTTITQAAAPFGLYDRQTAADLRADGFEALHTSDRGLPDPGAFLRPRNCLETGLGPDALTDLLTGRVPPMRRPRRALGLMRKRVFPRRLRP